MQVKGCSKRNRWHFCEDIGTVWIGVTRPVLRCVEIKCLCILYFLLNDWSQKEQTQLMSTPRTGAECRLKKRSNVSNLYRLASHEIPLLTPPPPQYYCFSQTSGSEAGIWFVESLVWLQTDLDNTKSCLIMTVTICIGNSMICSDIWHKYCEWYFKIVIRNITSR